MLHLLQNSSTSEVAPSLSAALVYFCKTGVWPWYDVFFVYTVINDKKKLIKSLLGARVE